MSLSVKENVKRLRAYTVESGRPDIKLDANENPYSIPEYIVEKLKGAVCYDELNRYPDARAVKLCSKLADYVGSGVDGDMIMAGDGSDELINIIISAFLDKGASIVLPSPGFTMYNIFSSVNEANIIQFPREDDFSLDIEKMLHIIEKEKPGLIFLCNPNNPTGTLTSRESIIRLVENAGCMVVVDEAYYEFSGLTAVDLLNEYNNLIIMRTLSKAWGLAALRLGYLVSSKDIINELLKVKSPFNVNTITQEMASIILDYEDYMKERTKTILEERDYLFKELKKIKNLKVYDTSANFIMVRVSDADGLSKELRNSGIGIRNFNNYQGISSCIRITVGTREENNRLLEGIRDFEGV